ncbi:gliding motility-associated ABC transporter substrate-binding protein GldG [Flexithrix dorotheae]|uniref:gliding motility-associated ABC transporter substrate-binding protein GldG n=1 Tax=Flexithrix dorotheae TaxID=70993 RepID=UPI00036AB82E|nr:gliding motility-associated ABC transporter substrate-binding protein GldG [Flexithrix dorotheae]
MIGNLKKWENILGFTAIFLFILLVNTNLRRVPLRFDLTEEKRYTVSDATKNMLKNLDDIVYIEVYLEGDLNSGFKRLQKSIRELLDEFKVYAGSNLEYKFVDPGEAPNPTARDRFYQQLAQKGLPPTTLYDNIDGKRTQKVIFPGAIISYRNKEKPVLLLKGNKASSATERLNQSVEGLEYEIASVIENLSIVEKKNIAFIEGHNELQPADLIEITNALQENYIVDRIKLDNPQLNNYQAVIIAQPKSAFSEEEKYYFDQYIMKGGRAMVLMDAIQMNLDSIALGGTYAFGYDLNIEDLLFRYGVRVNTDLIQDVQSGTIEVYTGNFGDQPSINKLPWPYYTFLNTFSKHPIVKNLDVVYSKFLSTVDTVKAPGIQKTPLIFTSQYTRVKNAPTMVDLNELREDLNQGLYKESFLPVAYLLEGSFKSHYATRFAPKGIDTKGKIDQSEPAKILVMSDGDVIRNEFDKQSKNPLPIDFDKSSNQSLSNKEFFLNAIAYLVDEDGLITSRAKQVTLRPLDNFRIKEEKLFWQILNIGAPVLMIILFGIARYYWRKKKYESNRFLKPKAKA